MPIDTISIADFIRSNHIQIQCERIDHNPNMPDSYDMDHWKCILSRVIDTSPARKRYARMTVYFSMGYGHNGKEPKAQVVLDCLASDASGIEDTFESWCSNYGYDTDSRKAEKTYKACVHSAARLRNFLGDSLYEQLLYHTERM